MGKRATIKDIAERAGVSIGTVHCALNAKPGVGEEARRRIIQIAKECDYRPNVAASSLKRKAVRIAAVFPKPVGKDRFYFSYVWNGLNDYLNSMRDFSVEVVYAAYANDIVGQARVLARLLGEERLDGILTLGYMNDECRAHLRSFKKRGVPVVLVGSDVAKRDRLFCVQPDYDIVGRTLGELLSWQAPGRDILVCAGSVATPSHYQIVAGLEAFFRDAGVDRTLVKIHEGGSHEEMRREIEGALAANRERIGACCSMYARGSVALGAALEATGRAGLIPAVGCDVFPENIRFLKRGTFSNLIQKNPYSQAYISAKCLTDYILKGVVPSREALRVGSEIVFRSALPLFRFGRQSLQAVLR